MERNRSSRSGLWIAVILVVVLSAAAGALVSMHFPKPVKVVTAPVPQASEQPPTDYDAASSWKVFVDDARAKCAKEGPDCTLDYTALHEIGENTFGVMVIGWKDSEYVIDMYRFDPAEGKWIASPTKQTEEAEEIDTFAASRKWGISQAILQEWINAADKAVKHKYAGRSN
jgi:hypothetical protein